MSIVALLSAPEVILKQDCPIAWPADPVPAALNSTDPETTQDDWIRLRYNQTVYLPEQLAPFEQLARDLQRMSLPKPASASRTPSDSPTSPVSDFLLTLPEIENKHRKRLSGPIESFIRGSGGDAERDLTTQPGLDGDFLDDRERRIWREGMGYRADSGVVKTLEGDQQEREIIKMRKRMTDEFERREVMVQIILLLTHHDVQESVKSDAAPLETDKKGKNPEKKKKRQKPASPASDPLAALDILTDRLTVWQAIGGTEISVYSENDVRGWINGKKLHTGAGEEDWVKRFWRIVVRPFFGGRGSTKKFVRAMHKKVFGADVPMEEDTPKTIVLPEPEVTVKRSMKREPSVVITGQSGSFSGPAQSNPSRSASLQAMQQAHSRRSSMESNSSVRMLSASTTAKDGSRAGSMGPPAPGRRVSGNAPDSNTLNLDETDLEGPGRSGSLRRSTSRVNSGVNLFKGREVGFSRSTSFLKPKDDMNSQPGPSGSTSQNTMGSVGAAPLGRTSSAMAGMNVILGKRKTMIVPKDKTASSGPGSFIKPTDLTRSSTGPTGLQKSFSTSTLAMATPSKPRYESRLTSESQPVPVVQAPVMSAFVAETPSNAGAQRQAAEDRYASSKASWESTKQVLFPSASQGETSSSIKGEDQHGLADFMEDTDDEDDGASFFTTGKRRRLDSNAKDNLRHVVLFRNPTGDSKQDPYTQMLTATKRFRPKSLSVLGQTFTNQNRLAELIAHEGNKWSGIVATSKRAGEAWRAACKLVNQEGHGSDAGKPDWSHVPLYTPGPATGASFSGSDLPLSLEPHRIAAAEATGSAIPLGEFIISNFQALAVNLELPLLILEGDKNGPNLTDAIGNAVRYERLETYATGPREDLGPDVMQLCQTLAADSGWNRAAWLVFFAPSSAKAVLDCLELTEFASGLPRKGAPSVESMLRFRLAAVGNTTAAYLAERGLEVEAVACQPTAEGIRDALLEAD